jgi:hypothetical protein
VNPGGEPERDDTGLPPVDIEIPDDARELDRDVQAYFRELRAERRRQRHGRWHGSLARDGIVLPLLACCLILALITGTLLTVFTATSEQNLVSPPRTGTSSNGARAGSSGSSAGPSSRAAPSGSTSAGPTPGAIAPSRVTTTPLHLPNVLVIIENQPIPLLDLAGGMLVLIPPHCQCITLVRRLASIGGTNGTALVGTQGTITEAQQYEAQLDPAFANHVDVVLDGQHVLQQAVSATGLTAVVFSAATSAGRPESVTYARNLTASDLTSGSTPVSAALVKALGR